MSYLRKRILPTLAVMVVACVQVFGMPRGYACDHNGSVVVTKTDHCHRDLAAGQIEFDLCESAAQNDCDKREDTERHSKVVEAIQAAPPSLSTVSLPAFVAVLVTEVSVHEWKLIQTLSESKLTRMPLDSGGRRPSASLQVARCMVILV
jgi:hypothetical protein